MKKWMIVSLSLLILIAGCSNKPQEVIDEETLEIQNSAASDAREYLNYKVNKEKKSVNRGLITMTINNRSDMDEIETGLMSLSTEHFSPEKYVYQEGQYLKNLNSWLGRKSKANKAGLNPELKITDDMTWEQQMEMEKKNPMYLAYIHEQNYVDSEGKIKGISLGLAMNSIDYIRVEDDKKLMHFDEANINEKMMEEYGKKVAGTVASRVRANKELKNVPIMISIFKLQPLNSVVPGNYIATTYLDENDRKIKKWDDVSDKYYYFPSDEGEEKDRDLYNRIRDLEDYVSKYFSHQDIEFVGKGLYQKETLNKLVIDVHTGMVKETELIGFAQAIGPEIVDYFPHTPVYLYVKTPKGLKATIVKEVDQEPFVQIH
ncbi:CamS family sex pheromone protein [Rossellomorea vietnamensis]|uniref:CamS family sex pheromone protein n=1 Tax=Rossellomorea vietnamensis TaxID=218284 RepID=UPI001E397320|nr:CamS family sex pheromone protein [Rossellomorea vietnamensis]MCC5802237.1 CamS family sex pheromone protein [Rossellomorea vietnamensis]WQI96626.1 CamS family sex pheromone protein [Rossellomorea vietnamensis]